jgi:hypothetical protein
MYIYTVIMFDPSHLVCPSVFICGLYSCVCLHIHVHMVLYIRYEMHLHMGERDMQGSFPKSERWPVSILCMALGVQPEVLCNGCLDGPVSPSQQCSAAVYCVLLLSITRFDEKKVLMRTYFIHWLIYLFPHLPTPIRELCLLKKAQWRMTLT